MNKKIIIGIIAAIVVIGGTVGTVLGVQAYNTNKEYEELLSNAKECTRMVENINYVYYPEDDGSKQARQRDLDKIKSFEEKIEAKNMTDDEKNEFSEFTKLLKKNFEQCKSDTKSEFDKVVEAKNSHTEEGYYTDEFNNEFNNLTNDFNNKYNEEKYFEAFQVVLNMQNKLNEYVAGKDKEAADRAEAERQQAVVSQKSSSSSNSASSKNSNSASGNNDASNGNQSSASNENNEGASSNDGHSGYTHDVINQMGTLPGTNIMINGQWVKSEEQMKREVLIQKGLDPAEFGL
ncbi:MAG: hypothetical protein E7279_09335 [Lachnospiraceae bacterium]|nr:hypothetical protein [Lachnospiraceae bacterium]